MAKFQCPHCDYTGHPDTINKAVVVGCWIVACPECRHRVITRTAYGQADVATHREEVAQ